MTLVYSVLKDFRGGYKMIYFTSDLHLGHPAIITMQNRPFVNVDEL